MINWEKVDPSLVRKRIVRGNTCATIVLGGSQFTRCIPLSKREAKTKIRPDFLNYSYTKFLFNFQFEKCLIKYFFLINPVSPEPPGPRAQAPRRLWVREWELHPSPRIPFPGSVNCKNRKNIEHRQPIIGIWESTCLSKPKNVPIIIKICELC